jgi:hypothetical protein
MWEAIDSVLDEMEDVVQEQAPSPSMKQHREYMKKARQEQLAAIQDSEPVVYKDFYEILGLKRSANQEEIRTAYLALARKVRS